MDLNFVIILCTLFVMLYLAGGYVLMIGVPTPEQEEKEHDLISVDENKIEVGIPIVPSIIQIVELSHIDERLIDKFPEIKDTPFMVRAVSPVSKCVHLYTNDGKRELEFILNTEFLQFIYIKKSTLDV